MGHSYKKVHGFEIYVARQNLSTLKFAYMEARRLAVTYRSVATIYDAIKIISDPMGTFVDSLDSKLVSKTYEVYGYVTDFEGSVKDALIEEMVDPVIDGYRERAEMMEKRCQILQEMITDCELTIES